MKPIKLNLWFLKEFRQMLILWSLQSNPGSKQSLYIHLDGHQNIQWLLQNLLLQLVPIGHSQCIEGSFHCRPVIFYKLKSHVKENLNKSNTWQVPDLFWLPIEQSVVSWTIFPNESWHSSLETIFTFNLFKMGLIEEAEIQNHTIYYLKVSC